MKRILFSVATIALFAAQSMAVTFQLDFGRVVTSSGDPLGSGPWATATFEDTGLNQVQFTFTHNAGSFESQKVKDVWFSVDPSVGSISATLVSDTSGKYKSFSFGQNSYNAALGASFDASLEFKTSQSGFAPEDVLVMNLTGTGLNAMSFDSLTAANGIGSTSAMMHILGIPGGYSAHLDAEAVPEPATMALAAPVALAWWRKRKKSA